MAGLKDNARTKAAAAAGMLLLTGALLGISLDRMWFRAPANAMQLTVNELSEHLDLAPAEDARMRALLDSIEPDIAVATAHGVDSLQSTALRAHERIEAALPAESRTKFRDWIRDHHDEMRKRMHGDGGGHSRRSWGH